MLELVTVSDADFEKWLRAESRAHGNRLDHDPEALRPHFDLARTIAVYDRGASGGGASGKGLDAYPGLHCAGAESGMVPFTLSSNLLAALDAGLQRQSDELLAQIDAAGRWVRQQLQELGLTLLPAADECMGAVTTIAFPAAGNGDGDTDANDSDTEASDSAVPTGAVDAAQLGRALEAHGFYTSYASGYLRDRNWLQICLLGEVQREQLERLLPVLAAQIDKMGRVPAR